MGKKRKTPRPSPATLELPRVGVDSHAHLDIERLRDDVPGVLARAAEAGVSRVGQVFLGHEAYLAGRELFAGHPEVFFLLGVHPNDADTFSAKDTGAMARAFADDPRLRAVGEIGLDYYWERVEHGVQKEAFAAQLHMARELDKPVVIHSRASDLDALDVLRAEGFQGYPVLWHCFGGDTELARAVLDLGCHVSLPGPLTYKANHELRRAAAFMGLERTLVETDCPYLSPEPWRGKPNEPALAAFTCAKLAGVVGVTPEEAWRRTGENAKAFFGLD
ncbi:TatD family hydrolase [Desulfohalovibrio reitneri]|uniref:TatD family hydrolase n=1 Tax=Desulfohalovibrio reitneri TaxID=1307759 RepID=UPI0004A7688D|nr:TatD family hydrolase [Desulfohalovibrio reitneri]